MISPQGSYPGYKGTCGIVCCANLLRLSGVDISEEELVDFAIQEGLCETSGSFSNKGATSPEEREMILSAFGLESTLESCTPEKIAQFVEEGRGVIICLDGDVLHRNGQVSSQKNNHAVTVTGVKRDSQRRLCSIFVCDSEEPNLIDTQDRHCEEIFVATLENCLIGKPMNVTTDIIR